MHSSPATQRFTLIESSSDRELSSFADEVARGLRADRKSIPCRFLYDEEGSRLFEEICELPEYYLTRVEREILGERASEVAAAFGAPITLAELGSGSSAKTRLLIEACLRAHGGLRYLPVDISGEILTESALALLDDYGALQVRAIASEYSEGLRHVRAETERPKLIAWLGSSIGNLSREGAGAFLGRVRSAMAPRDRLLLGVDLRKDPKLLEAAYDDAAGVTARFSLNLLVRVNRELGGDFDPSQFRHRARYHEADGRVEIELVSLREQRVAIDGLDLEVDFAAGEGIHVENSFKYSTAEIHAVARDGRLSLERQWCDSARRFSLNLLAPA
jgi:L-histidine N-alpha-methyltransferase